jgi:CubicO group peptidase (beta-lactamase class C family)
MSQGQYLENRKGIIVLFTQGKIQWTPDEAGYSNERLEKLKSHFQALVDENNIYCATYCLSRKGKIFAHGGIGYKTYKKDPDLLVSPTDAHYIASITKTFVGVAIMKLVEDGVTRLDVGVNEILPQFKTPPFDKISLFHLLTHTSGMHPDGGCLPNKYNEGSYWQIISNAYQVYKFDTKKNKQEFDWIAAALAYGINDVPDKDWMYCSFGYVLLGEIISKLTGMCCHKYIEENICKPLGLSDTGFDLTPELAKRYIIHSKDAEKYVDCVIKGKKYKYSDNSELWDKIPSTGGGMISSVADLIRYGNMMLHNGTFDGVRIMGRKSVEKMTKTAVEKPNYCWGGTGDFRRYGIGFDRRTGREFTFSDSTYMHEGSGASALYIDPEEDFVAAWIVPFVNRNEWSTRAMYDTSNIIWSGLI